MNDDAGGWLWLVMDVGFVLVLAAALIYGTMQWRKGRRGPDGPLPKGEEAPLPKREQATRELYSAEERRRVESRR